MALAAAAAVSPARADDRADVRGAPPTEIHIFALYDASLASAVYAPDVVWQNAFGQVLRKRDGLWRVTAATLEVTTTRFMLPEPFTRAVT